MLGPETRHAQKDRFKNKNMVVEQQSGLSSQPCSKFPQEQVFKSGWLRKQRNIMKNWQLRWFVLRKDQLLYFKDENEVKPQGFIPLQDSQVKEVDTNHEESGKYLFEIATDQDKMPIHHEVFLLSANSQNDLEDWLKAIRRAISASCGRGIFGQCLEETVQYEKKYGQHLAPLLVVQCVDFIRKHGLTEEGLFRMPGQANLVKDLQDSFDSGKKPLFDSHTDVHTVASLLKLYLRELPEPVIPFTRYEDFLSCGHLLSKDKGEGTLELAKHVKNLPQANYNLLKYLCNFLDEVQSHSSHNKMSVQNLATVFGPNILRPQVEDPVTIMESTSLVQHLMTALISKRVQIFGEPLTEGSRDQWQTCGQCPFGVRDWISTDGRTENKLESRFARPVSFLPETPSPATVAIIQEGHSKRNYDHSAPDPSKRGQPFPTWIQDARSLGHKIGGTVLNSPSLPSNGSWLMNELYSFQGHYRSSSGGVVQDSGSSQRLSTYDNVPISTPSLSTHKSASVAWSTSSCDISATTDSIHSCAAYRATDSSAISSLPVEWVTYNSLPHSQSCQYDSMERSEEPKSNNSDWRNLAGAPRDSADSSGDLKSLIAELKAELNKQRAEFESTIKRTEETSTELKKKAARLEEELDQERKKYMLLEIKLRDSERARKDADKRNYLLQEEMETFFTTLRNLNVESQVAKVPK